MRTVRDEDGNQYLLLKESGESSLVRDPTTGETHHVKNESITTTGEAPLVTAAEAIDPGARFLISAASSEHALGLLCDLVDVEKRSIRDMLDRYEVCESDLHGILAELAVAGAIEETKVAGERGYKITEEARRGIENLR
ncbi:MAG: hypothetical protein ABEI52_01615 [Halobacteriaceae archaeon]